MKGQGGESYWETEWSTCCAGRMVAQYDPLRATRRFLHDAAGNVTIEELLYSTTTYASSTTRYDSRRRPTARTVWLVDQELSSSDAQSPPIAGLDSEPTHDGNGNPIGLTTRYYYDEDLTDNVGLDNSTGVSVSPMQPSHSSFNVSVQKVLARLAIDYGATVFGTGAKGSAVAVVNPEDETTVSISDAAGRTIATGQLDRSGNLLSCRTVKHDATVSIGGYGDVVETAQIVRTTIDQSTPASDVLSTAKTRADAAGRTLQTLDPLSEVTAMTYDANGNTLSVRDPNSVGVDMVYDNLNRNTSRTDTQGDESATVFNKAGDVIGTIDAKDHTITFAYDARGRKSTQTDRISGVTVWTYDDNGNLLSLTDAESRTTSYTYNARNHQLTEVYPDATPNTVTFGYDDVGRRASRTDQLGETISFVYDMANRLTARQYPNSQNDTFSYDDAGRLLTADSDRYNNTVTLAYGDQAGRPTSESLTVNFGAERTYTTQSVFDAAGRRTEITYPDGYVATRSYTARDELYQIGYNSNTISTSSYDDGGRLTGETYGNGVSTSRTYGRDDNFVTAITATNLPSLSYSYGYDANKNKTTETIGGAMANYGFDSTTYDNEDRLTAWQRADSGKDQSWTLTAVGDWSQFVENQTTQNRTHNEVHELTAINQTSLTYDVKGNLTTDQNGLTYVWDYDNRLRSINTGEWSYTYDALGRRVSKAQVIGEEQQGAKSALSSKKANASKLGLAKKKASSTQVVTVYVSLTHPIEHSPYAGQVVAEYLNTAAASSPTRKYVYASYIDEPVLLINVGESSETLLYYHRNSLYSIIGLTDSNGSIVEHYAYTAYGVPLILAPDGSTVRVSSSYNNVYLFTGREYDAESGNYNYRARPYGPAQGRFLGRDPIEADINLYRYCGDRPTFYIDPSGFANFWNPLTYGLNNPVQSWWGFFNPFSDENIDVQNAFYGGYVDSAVNGQQASSFTGFVDSFTNSVNPFGGGTQIGPLWGQNSAYSNGQSVGAGTGIAVNTVLMVSGMRGIVTTVQTIQTTGGALQIGQFAIAGGGTMPFVFINGEAVALTPALAAQLGISLAAGSNIDNALGKPSGGRGTTGPTEQFKNPADAIGDTQGKACLSDSASTKNQWWRDLGFTETRYYYDSNGVKHTVFYNPRTGMFSGAHVSSGQ